MEEIEGVGITSRKGAGEAHIYSPEKIEVQEESDRTVEEEEQRFEDAKEEAEEQIEAAAEKAKEKAGEHDAEIFDAQIQFLKDPQIEENVQEFLDEGLTAEKAVRKGFEDPIEQLESQEGRMKERADDLRDIRERLVTVLAGEEREGLSGFPENSVVVAEKLTPSDTTDIDDSSIEGIITAEGSRTAHAAILARSMGVPAIVGAGESIEKIEEDRQILVDGENDRAIIEPDEEMLENIDNEEVETIPEKVETQDGEEIEVAANVADPEEVSKAEEDGADGIGLYRTEFMFIEREEPPTEEEHYENYVEALETFEGDRVIVRTLDIGGDKEVPYLDLDRGDNPFLGPRGIRLAFGEGEELFRTQMKALLRAAATENGDSLAVMFPLISEVEELEGAYDIIEDLERELEEEGKDHERPETGLMVETPSAVQIAGDLAEKADFLSIGTNDLTQYTMAASRTDNRVSELQNPLHPSVLRSIRETVEKGQENDAWVGMCGEMAGNPELTELLVGLGLDELSMAPAMVPRVKNSVKSIPREGAEEKADRILQASTMEEVEEIL